jgi:hypothetical protein
VKYCADTVMDLSTGKDIDITRGAIIGVDGANRRGAGTLTGPRSVLAFELVTRNRGDERLRLLSMNSVESRNGHRGSSSHPTLWALQHEVPITNLLGIFIGMNHGRRHRSSTAGESIYRRREITILTSRVQRCQMRLSLSQKALPRHAFGFA